MSSHGLFSGFKSKVPSTQQERRLLEGKFMTLDPMKRVEPDRRKLPYRKKSFYAKADFPESPTKCTNGGEFISLPKKISLQKGKYINLSDNSRP